MKVLVATSKTQGARSDDYHRCVDGELVWIQEPCACDLKGCHPCGCGRGFAGLTSHRPTTTAMVKDIAGLTIEEYTLALETSFADGGWPVELAGQVAKAQAEFVAGWRDGAIVERDFDWFSERIPLRWLGGASPSSQG